MFGFFGRKSSLNFDERREWIDRYKKSRSAIDRFHLEAARTAVIYAKSVHGEVRCIVAPHSSQIVGYSPETKVYLGGWTARELIRHIEYFDVDDPEMPLADIKMATVRSENSLDSVLRGIGGGPWFTEKHQKMLKEGFFWDQVPLSWVGGIMVKKSGRLIAHAAPGAIRELTELPSKIFDCLRSGVSLAGDFASLEVSISYATEETQSLHETSRLIYIYQDVPYYKSDRNARYIDDFSSPILGFLRSITSDMRECNYQDYILKSCARWMKNPEPGVPSSDADEFPFF